MQWTGLNELRESFLSFFESKAHTRLKSAPLVPQGDNSVLLINAGMTPLKKYFQGIEHLSGNRAASCQKCIRTPDIENVGHTERHGTYFEMLGNFSFGDYFKKEAIHWAWEYLTGVLAIPTERLWVTVFEEDNEAANIWHEQENVPYERIVKLGRESNFWEHGSGPCGPCSEIHFDRGADKGCGKPTCGIECDCGRYVEIWNLVFTQFDSDGNGNYSKLATQNIDTGMGLERLACVMQGADNLFEVDTVKNIMAKICDIIGKTYKADKDDDVSIRIITDHIRSTVFMTGDGVLPSNEGRGYVLRRLLRRAARNGRLLGYNKPFLHQVCQTVIDENLSAYPELGEKRAYIEKVIRTEEENFAKTIDGGLKILAEMTKILPKGGALSGEDAFKLHGTFGFPLDLTREILAEKGFKLDEAAFKELMRVERMAARIARKFKGGWDEAENGAFGGITTKFVGYDTLETTTEITAIAFGESEEDISLTLAETPFYAESGGQSGDVGVVRSDDAVIEVTDTKKLLSGAAVCRGILKSGTVNVGDTVNAAVDKATRLATMRNHTSAHLLQAALRQVLGEHVHQAGQLVDSKRCRFDFTHFSALTSDELTRVEKLVNEEILTSKAVVTEELPIDEAKKRGAAALFGEKYGSVVRVVTVPDFSAEFCGGTHVRSTGEIGLFKILSESGVAGGVRRIEAVTGTGVLHEYLSLERTIAETAGILKTNSASVLQKARALTAELAAKTAELESLTAKLASNEFEKAVGVKEINGIKLIVGKLHGISGADLRNAADNTKGFDHLTVVLIAGIDGEKANLVCKCGTEAVKRGAKAGDIIKAACAAAGGKGGGKPDSAMGGANTSELAEAFAEAEKILATL
ncbi:MAG: alanine--tRNA ligase [Oscillospiraceae bacterium]|jgi:alanyl-tRNA synthetase|nr:alanine--tRNA ligase [Oscillospiraceae bacterium]